MVDHSAVGAFREAKIDHLPKTQTPLREVGIMTALIDKLFPIAFAIVVGLYIQHPKTWRVELAKLQHSILKEAIRTDNWGCPSIYGKAGCHKYHPERYR